MRKIPVFLSSAESGILIKRAAGFAGKVYTAGSARIRQKEESVYGSRKNQENCLCRFGMLPVCQNGRTGRRDVCPAQSPGQRGVRGASVPSPVRVHPEKVQGTDEVPRFLHDGPDAGRPHLLCRYHGDDPGRRDLRLYREPGVFRLGQSLYGPVGRYPEVLLLLEGRPGSHELSGMGA